VFNYILLIFVVLYASLMLCNEELSVCTYRILLVQEAKMNWEYVHAEGLRMHTGLKLAIANAPVWLLVHCQTIQAVFSFSFQ